MIVKTLNSTYRVQFGEGPYLITKISAENPESQYVAVGETRRSTVARIRVGETADFDHWHTSRVVSLSEECSPV